MRTDYQIASLPEIHRTLFLAPRVALLPRLNKLPTRLVPSDLTPACHLATLDTLWNRESLPDKRPARYRVEHPRQSIGNPFPCAPLPSTAGRHPTIRGQRGRAGPE